MFQLPGITSAMLSIPVINQSESIKVHKTYIRAFFTLRLAEILLFVAIASSYE